MVVVHLVSSGQLGGAETSVVEMTRSLREAHPGWRVRVICPERGPLVERLEGAAVPVEVEEFPARLTRLGETRHVGARFETARMAMQLIACLPAVLRYARALRQRFLAADGDPVTVLHTHGFKMHVLGALARPETAAIVWHVHDYVGARRTSVRILRRLAHRIRLVIANSDSVAADIRRALGAGVEVATMYNAIDLERFSPTGHVSDLDALGGVAPPPGDVVRIGLPGTFGVWKGHREFIEAIAQLRELPVRAYLIGGPVYKTAGSQETIASLRAHAERLHVADRVVFTGAVPDLAPALRALDVVVHASTHPEPFGMVIAEAMASGRAVVVSGAGGAVELVRPGVDGLLHRPGDVDDLARQISTLVNDRALRRRLGEAARASAEARFDRARLSRELTPLYGVAIPASASRRLRAQALR
jgi:glycosyltransferase involved in cell wall biosynthesis